MELRVLRYFLTVARKQSISAAAEALHLTQPTLSRQLIDLERELGVQLFIRGKRKITLTDEGVLLRRRAEEITELVQKTQAEMAATEEAVRGDIRIGGGETHAMRLVAGILQQLHGRHPGIRAHLFSGNAEEVTERLDKGLLDFGILIQPADVSRYRSLPLPAQDRWGVLLRKDDPLAARQSVGPEDLWDRPLIASRQRLMGGQIAQWIQKEYAQGSVHRSVPQIKFR